MGPWKNPFAPSSAAKARVSALRQRLEDAPGSVSVAVVGAGRSGRAAAALVEARGARVRVLDDVADVDGPIVQENLADADLVVLSPGVPRKLAALAPSIERGNVVGEIELASWFVSAPLIGVTGTNGKSTTTSLIAHILAGAGRRVFVGGNLGRPFSELVTSGEEVDVAVVELSSYQLESIVDATFDVACWLNVTPDHTDRYVDVDTYAAAKRRLLERRSVRGVGVLNAKDSSTSDAGITLGGRLRWFSAEPESDLAGPSGTRIIGSYEAVRTVGGETELYVFRNAFMPGAHNQANMAAAIECVRHLDVAAEDVQAGLRSFTGLAHRLELVGERCGARWFNDSKATNVDSALTGLTAVGGPLILIAGGRDKGAPWTPLREHVAQRPEDGRVEAVLAVGEAEPQVVEAFEGIVPNVERCGDLATAVARAAELAPRVGGSVLLSPACASFDQFKSFEVRGDAFRSAVLALPEGGAS